MRNTGYVYSMFKCSSVHKASNYIHFHRAETPEKQRYGNYYYIYNVEMVVVVDDVNLHIFRKKFHSE